MFYDEYTIMEMGKQKQREIFETTQKGAFGVARPVSRFRQKLAMFLINWGKSILANESEFHRHYSAGKLVKGARRG